jgi:homoserine dehydrogenase
VADNPGVLSQITGVLGEQGISIASVIQHEPEGADHDVPLVIRTHSAAEGAVATATKKIDRLPMVRASSVRMRVLD